MKIKELKEILQAFNDNDDVVILNTSSEWYGVEPLDAHVKKRDGTCVIVFDVNDDIDPMLSRYKRNRLKTENTVM